MTLLEKTKYNKFYSNFDPIIRKLAQLKPNLFNHIDLEDFLMFFEEPCSKGKNKGLPRSYNIFDYFVKNLQIKFSDDTYIADVCRAMTYNKINCRNGLSTTTCERMVYMYRESAHCKTAFVDYESLENELYIEESTVIDSLVVKELKDIMYHKVFEDGYLNVYFNGSDLIMLKEYLESKILGQSNSIKDFTNHYLDSRRLTAKAYDTRLRNVYKAWVAFLAVNFDLWTLLSGAIIPFETYQECIDYLNNLKPLKERKEYMKKLTKELKKCEKNENSTSEGEGQLIRNERRSIVLKEYLIQKYGLSNVKKVDKDFEVKIGNKWCCRYFLNGGYNNFKTGEKGSWLSLLVQ